MELQGITIKETIGIGDKIQFSALPENYFRATGHKLVDVSRSWIFDSNPYVARGDYKLNKVTELWNFSPRQYQWPRPRKEQNTYHALSEILCAVFGVPMVLNRPRLYVNEGISFRDRTKILLQPSGRSHGELSEEILQHVIDKYRLTGELHYIGTEPHKFLESQKIPRIETPSLQSLVNVISSIRMFIGPDSGPSWISACYPDIITKIVRTKPSSDILKTWTPLEIDNVHSHWDDRCRQIHNTTRDDIGFTYSYLRL